MKRRKLQGSPILLPWERQNPWLRELVSGRRWRSLLAGLCVVGLLAFAYRAADHRARVRSTRAAIAEARRAVETFVAEMGRCPRSTVELVHPPKTGARYLASVPTDGWGKTLYVRCQGSGGYDIAEVISAGPSGSFLDDDNVF